MVIAEPGATPTPSANVLVLPVSVIVVWARAEKLVRVPIGTASGALADAGVATMRSPEVATLKATRAAPVRRNNPSLDRRKFRFISDTSKSSSGKPGGSFDFIVLPGAGTHVAESP